LKIITWNVNGMEACLRKGLLSFLQSSGSDFYCFQEVRSRCQLDLPGYTQYWNLAERKGYSGTLTLAKKEALSIQTGFEDGELNAEGRLIALEYGDFWLVNVYVPNSQSCLARAAYRERWDAALYEFLAKLDKPVILCGDLNVAYNANDLVSDAQGMQTPGFTREERGSMAAILRSGFVDAYRHFHPKEAAGASLYRKGLRAVGMDYFIVSERLLPRVLDVRALARVRGSDHYPMELTLAE